jgi:hypothetical protein
MRNTHYEVPHCVIIVSIQFQFCFVNVMEQASGSQTRFSVDNDTCARTTLRESLELGVNHTYM